MYPEWDSSTTACPRDASLTRYRGSGVRDDPYIVDWDTHDPENPLNFSLSRKCVITTQLAFATWTVSFASSVYSSGLADMAEDLHISANVAILGISLYVLGFALGPLIFAPMSEMYGRRLVFFISLGTYTLFQLQGCLSKNNIYAILASRLLTGIFGSSPLTNAPSQICDIWDVRERGLAAAAYSIMPFLGPITGPLAGGLLVAADGWHMSFWLMFIFAVLALLSGAALVPETYAPVLLRRRARQLQNGPGAGYYVSVHDCSQPRSLGQVLAKNFSRPFLFLRTEPIVLGSALCISLVYGTLYAMFAAFPVIFTQHHHFTSMQNGLAFLGIGLGLMIGLATTSIQNRIYRRAAQRNAGFAPPEARLHQAMFGSVLFPVGLFWFALTASPSIHWIIPITGSVFFGTGIAQVLTGLTMYLTDTYNLYLASAVASTIVMRSFVAAFLPQGVPSMFTRLGDSLALCVFGALWLVLMPIPFCFWKFGGLIRSKSGAALKDPSTPRSQVTSHCETLNEKHQAQTYT